MGLHFFSWIIEKNILTSPIKAGNRASNSWAWCFTSRKALFLRPEAPRHSGRMGLRRLGRGASPSAKPCSFVRRHHATRVEWVFGGWDVVLHLPQSLVPSSGGTTPLGPNGSSAVGTWCFTSRKALFLRPEAPRHSERIRAVPGSVDSPESVNKNPPSKLTFEGGFLFSIRLSRLLSHCFFSPQSWQCSIRCIRRSPRAQTRLPFSSAQSSGASSKLTRLRAAS